jgi:hypothetical protein
LSDKQPLNLASRRFAKLQKFSIPLTCDFPRANPFLQSVHFILQCRLIAGRAGDAVKKDGNFGSCLKK